MTEQNPTEPNGDRVESPAGRTEPETGEVRPPAGGPKPPRPPYSSWTQANIGTTAGASASAHRPGGESSTERPKHGAAGAAGDQTGATAQPDDTEQPGATARPNGTPQPDGTARPTPDAADSRESTGSGPATSPQGPGQPRSTGAQDAAGADTGDEPETAEVVGEDPAPDGTTAGDSGQVAELTADLQRVAAEYKNYRARTQRDISDARSKGREDVVTELLATLDDLDRAAEHGDLTGPIKALADNLTAALNKLGVERFGDVGEPFDPMVHEALTHNSEEGHDQPTVTAVYQPGYRIGERTIRAARVGVTE